MLSKINGNEAVVSACGQGNGLFVLKVYRCAEESRSLGDVRSLGGDGSLGDVRNLGDDRRLIEDETVHKDTWYSERIRNARTERRKVELARGCLLLHEALEEAVGMGALIGLTAEDLSSPQIQVGEHGKPDFAMEGMHFNISHSEEYIACILSDKNIGIDIQADYRWKNMDAGNGNSIENGNGNGNGNGLGNGTGDKQKVARSLTGLQYLAPEERAELEALGDQPLARILFFTWWARKEALAKYHGKPLATVLGTDVRDEALPALCAREGVCFDDSIPAPGIYMSVCIEV